MLTKKSLCFIFFLVSLRAVAYDPYRVTSVTVGLEVPFISYNLKDLPGEGSSFSEQLNYEPNSQSFIKISAGFTDFNISLSFENKGGDEKENDLQTSKIFDLQFVGVFKRVFWEAYYQNYHDLFVSDKSGNADFEQPSVSSYNYGIDLTYFNNESFQPQRTFSHFGIKKETNWSLVQKVKVNNARFWSSSGLIPNSLQDDFEQLQSLTSIETTALGYEFGGVASYKTKNFFTSAMFSVGPTVFLQRFSGISQRNRSITSPTSSFLFDAGITDARNKVLSLHFRFDNYTFPVRNIELTRSRGIASLSFKYFLP